MSERNGAKLVSEFAYMNINIDTELRLTSSATVLGASGRSSEPIKSSDRLSSRGPPSRVSHSCEKLTDSELRSRSCSPLRTGMASVYGTPLRTPKQTSGKRASDTSAYASIDRPVNHVVSYYGGDNDMSEYANICLDAETLRTLTGQREHGSAEGRIELTSRDDGKTSPNPRTRSSSFRSSLRSASFMRFLRRANAKDPSRRSHSDETFSPENYNSSGCALSNFRRERSISLPIKGADEESFHRGPSSPETRPEHGSWTGSYSESPKRFHTIHENSFRVRAPRTISCSAQSTQTFDLPKQRTEIETQKAVRCKSVSFSSRAERCTSMPIPISSGSRPRIVRQGSCSGDYTDLSPRMVGSADLALGRKRDHESTTTDGHAKILSNHSLDGEGFVPTSVYGKIVPLDDANKTSTLRPRSGKEYSKVNRRRSERLESSDGHSEISSSPVFDADMSDSPNGSRCFSDGSSQHLSVSPDPIYVNIPIPRHGAERSPVYMNVEMTPPATPPQYSASPQPLELINPLLNYCEVDLSPGGRSKPRASIISLSRSPPSANSPLNYVGIERVDSTNDVKKVMRIVGTVSSANDIRKSRNSDVTSSDYAQIDVSATTAIEQMVKDRRQNVRLSSSPLLGTKLDRKSSFINRESMIVRDRKGSVP